MKKSALMAIMLLITAATTMLAFGLQGAVQTGPLPSIHLASTAIPTGRSVDYAASSFGAWPPLGGWVLNPASGTGAWARGSLLKGPNFSPNSGAEGTRHFAEFNSFDWAVGTVGDMISPAVILPSPAVDCSLSFYFWNHSYSVANYNYDTVTVSITTNGGSSWAVITKLYGNVDTWSYRSFPLGGYAGQTVQIKFHAWSDYGASDPSIDEVKIGRKPADNVGVFDIVTPGPSMPGATSPMAIVKNYGTNTETFDAVCTIDSLGTVVYTNTQTVSGLAPGAQQTVTFGPYTPVPLNGDIYTATVYTTLAADGDPSNDTLNTVFNSNPFQRIVLGMDWTAMGCTWCPWHQYAWHRLKEEVGDSLCVIALHVWTSDSFYIAHSLDLQTYYGVGTSIPASLMDGSISWIGSDTVGAGTAQYEAFRFAFDQRKLLNVGFGMTLNGTYNGNAGTLNVSTNYPGTTPIPITMRVAIIEDSKYSIWPSVGHPLQQDSVYDFLRDVLPSSAGDTFSVTNGTITRSYPFTITTGWNTSKLAFIAWAEKRGLKENVQTGGIRYSDLVNGVAGEPSHGPAYTTSLAACTPNPMIGATIIRYSLAIAGAVTLNVYDISGRLVRTLANGPFPAGAHSVLWDGRNGQGNRVANGVYLYQMRTGSYTASRKIVLVK